MASTETTRPMEVVDRTVVITPRVGWAWPRLTELWDYRELLYFLVWRNLKVRYRQTAFGASWALLQPILLMAIFAAVLGRVAGIGPPEIPYPIFALAALVPWTLFAQSVAGASSSLVDSSNLLQKVYFPRLLLPLAAIGGYVVDFAIGLVLLLLVLFATGEFSGLRALFVFPLVALAILTAFGVGVWLAAVNVRYRDVRHAVPFLVQLWLLASPVAYSTSLVPAEWRFIYGLNPMVGVIEGFRWALLPMEHAPVAFIFESLVVALVLVIAGLAYFGNVERTFADVI